MSRLRIVAVRRLLNALQQRDLTIDEMSELACVARPRMFSMIERLETIAGVQISMIGQRGRAGVFRLVDNGIFSDKFSAGVFSLQWKTRVIDKRMRDDDDVTQRRVPMIPDPEHATKVYMEPYIHIGRVVVLLKTFAKGDTTVSALSSALNLTPKRLRLFLLILESTCDIILEKTGTGPLATLSLTKNRFGIFDRDRLARFRMAKHLKP